MEITGKLSKGSKRVSDAYDKSQQLSVERDQRRKESLEFCKKDDDWDGVDRSTHRKNRVEAFTDLHDAVDRRGGDQFAHGQAQNAVYSAMGGKPSGNRDNLPRGQQEAIAVCETIAADRVLASRPSGGQSNINKTIVDAAHDGALDGADLIADRNDSGVGHRGWFSWLRGAGYERDILPPLKTSDRGSSEHSIESKVEPSYRERVAIEAEAAPYGRDEWGTPYTS